MKKWIVYVVIGLIMAGSASAAVWSFESKEKPGDPPAIERSMQLRPGGPGAQNKRTPLSEKQRAEMKAHREAIQQLVDAARTETDPAKKAVLVDQLRVKLTDGAKKMQAEFSERLKKAEQGVEKMKQRLVDGKQNRAQRVEEHLQKLLTGETPEGFTGKRPDGDPHKKRAPAVK